MGNLELFAQNTIRKHLWVLSGGQRKWALARDHDREERRRSIWPRLTLTADKTWMITTPVHYQRRSSSTSVFGWVGEWVSVSLHLFHYLPISSSSSSASSSSASPLCAIIIIIHLPPSEYFILLMTIISRPSLKKSFTPLEDLSLTRPLQTITEWLVYFLLQHSFSSPPAAATTHILMVDIAKEMDNNNPFSNNCKFPIINVVLDRSSSSSTRSFFTIWYYHMKRLTLSVDDDIKYPTGHGQWVADIRVTFKWSERRENRIYWKSPGACIASELSPSLTHFRILFRPK